jgi:hypothetical protein
MAFVFAYSLDGDNSNSINDLPLDTLANYKTSGTNGVTKGDLVFQSSGLLRRNGVTTGAGIGVIEGTEFTGLVAAGQPYAATNSSFTASAIDTTAYPNGVGKVRMDKSSVVYKVPVYQTGAVVTATNANLGGSYALGIDAAGDQQVDLNTTTTPAVKVIGLSKDGKSVFVQLV